jgi:phage baseplate assembly protein W
MAGILVASDRNILGRKSAVVSQRKPYSDLDVSLSRDVTNDIAPLKDIDAVKAAVKNLVLTSFGERPFQPNLGSAIKGLLFEPADRISIAVLRKSIVDVLRKNEPRIDSITIEVKDESENNRYMVDLGFRVISLNQEVDISFYLQRVR